MNTHKTIIHSTCPINGSWDYYDLVLETSEFIKCEDVDEIANLVRGVRQTQEEIADTLRHLFRGKLTNFKLTLEGRHGQNNELKICLAA